MRRLLVISSLLLLLAGMVFAIDVELNHPVYPFLERCELKGYLHDPLSGARPYTRRSVAEQLVHAAEHRSELTRIERRQLDYFLFEFVDDLQPGIGDSLQAARSTFRFEQRGSALPWNRLGLYKDPRYLYSTRGEDYLVAFIPHLESGVDLVESDDESGRMNRFASGFAVVGYYGDFGLLAIARDAHFSGDADLADASRYPVRFPADERSSDGFEFDESDAMFSYERPHVQLSFGKGSNKWDWGESGSLGLSGHTTTYTHFRYRFTFQPLEVTGIHGRLRQLPPFVTRVDTLSSGDIKRQYAEKWMVGHHYQVNMFPWLQLGLWDLLVYGNRGLEFDYIPPLSFLWSSEHYAHDQDNVMLGVDGRFTPGWRSELYFQWFLDELQFSQLGSDWWGNKHGFLFGARQVDPFGMANASAAIEYQRLRPYLYSHSVPYNNATHYGLTLGSELPPNSDMIFLSWRQNLRWNLVAWFEGRRIRHGSSPSDGRNVGDDPNRLRDQNDPEIALFLDGDLHTVHQARFGVSWEMTYQLFLDGSVQIQQEKIEPEIGTDRIIDTIALFAALRWHPARWR